MGVLRVGDLVFEWDDAKSHANLLKHGVSFLEAATVFHDGWGILTHDPAHSEGEDRFVLDRHFARAENIDGGACGAS
jgi:uncharacterized protein